MKIQVIDKQTGGYEQIDLLMILSNLDKYDKVNREITCDGKVYKFTSNSFSEGSYEEKPVINFIAEPIPEPLAGARFATKSNYPVEGQNNKIIEFDGIGWDVYAPKPGTMIYDRTNNNVLLMSEAGTWMIIAAIPAEGPQG